MQFGKYVVLEQIGEGGFGRIYSGYDPVLKRTVAIKTCTLPRTDLRARFVREAEIAANLRHPNIVPIFDFGEQDGEPYLVQEYLPGEDLNTIIESERPLPVETKIDYLLQVARGLAYAHAQSVVHRDVKPANIRVQPGGVIRIMDFGIAKVLESDEQLTQIGMSIGTVGYLAPEQLRGQPIDHRADIFSFGALAYELVTYQKAFPGDDITTIFYRIAHEEPEPIPALRSDCPPLLVACIERCLRKLPDERYGSLAGAVADLETALAEVRGNVILASSSGSEGARAGGRGAVAVAASSGAAVAPWADTEEAAAGTAHGESAGRRGLGPRGWGLVAAAVAVAVFGVVNVSRMGDSAPPDAGPVADAEGDGGQAGQPGPASDPAAARNPSTAVSDQTGRNPNTTAGGSDSGRSAPTQRDAASRGAGGAVAPGAADANRNRAAAQTPPPATNPTPTSGAPAGAATTLPAGRVLVLLYGAEGAAESAESALVRELLDGGAEVLDATILDAEATGRGTSASLSALGRQLGAGTIVVAQLAADAQPSVGAFFTGTATLALKTYDGATGRLLATETFQVGAGQTPGKLGPTALAAASDAATEVGRRAGRAAARQIASRR